MRHTGASLAGLLLVASCGSGHEIDDQAWKRDLAAQGQTVEHWSKFRDVWVDRVCTDSQDELEAFVAAGLDDGAEREFFRTNIENACPDRMDDLEQAFTNVQG